MEIAKNGLGTTAPNPMVGAVIVYGKKIIGEGFTSAYGGAHAEVNAINSVVDPTLLEYATLYVSLEPCVHFGKTPPCVDLILKHRIKKIVIGILDPHEKVAGKGVQKLIDASCDVTVGVLEKECRAHHKRFLTFHQKKRPYIILKWAETLDGFIAPKKEERTSQPEPFWITGRATRQIVHQWRSEEQAILTGTNTVLEDNPKLNVRYWKGKNPVRIVLDRKLKIGRGFNVFDKSAPTIVLTEVTDASFYLKDITYELIGFQGNVAAQICEKLYQHKINSVIVEGGSQTLQTFVDAGLWDEARVLTGNTSFHQGLKAPVFTGCSMEKIKIDRNTLKIYKPC
ncbi:Diaminohydroxyphosphoribosylaminopyrimidine deaminase / 5-amino-6-(5-phosphoribosylamino)uracil reductase [hydrothermal vent metagenome]|uniref:Diaminohydroxyphosphoribosylaminopyrimidine deaminase / 5-amino-6-(5-phosphoribosylamino)uracil reductase n=1 Tax=hydrothermal vent metagenome TaxID=652676 RepID=A0A3B0T1D7_9ZZZZ